MEYTDINWSAVLVSVVASMVLGYAWYSKALFGKAWMMLVGKQEADLKAGAGKAMGGTVILAFITSFTFSYLFQLLGRTNANLGFNLAVGILLPVMLMNILFERRPTKLFWINWGYQLVNLTMIGLIFSFWPA